MTDFPKTFVRNGKLRKAHTPSDAVKLKFDGYREVADETALTLQLSDPETRAILDQHASADIPSDPAAEAAPAPAVSADSPAPDEPAAEEGTSGVDSWETNGGPAAEETPKPRAPRRRD